MERDFLMMRFLVGCLVLAVLNVAEVSLAEGRQLPWGDESDESDLPGSDDGVRAGHCNQFGHVPGCPQGDGRQALPEQVKSAVQVYKTVRMKSAVCYAKSVLPREVLTPLKDVPFAVLHGSDIKEMLNPKAVYASACNGVSPEVHEEAVLRTPELMRRSKEVLRRPGGRKNRVVMKNGVEVMKEDPIAEIVELDAVFLASDGEIYTACFSVQKYKQTNMQPKIYFVFCKKGE